MLMKKGDVRPDVRVWQQFLADSGAQIAVNGTFDQKTEAATKAWQTARGVAPTGKLDYATQKLLVASFQPNVLTAATTVSKPNANKRALKLVATAFQQRILYGEIKETNQPLSKQIGVYWQKVLNTSQPVSTPWSAVFVSWCAQMAGYSMEEFPGSSYHSHFVYDLNKAPSQSFSVVEFNKADVAVGDIVHHNRRGGKHTFPYAQNNREYKSHSNIVVWIENGIAYAIGGNEGNSVGLRQHRLDNGRVKQRTVNPYISLVKNSGN